MGSQDLSGLLCFPRNPAVSDPTRLSLFWCFSQGFSWGDSLSALLHCWHASAVPSGYRTTFLFKYHHLSPLCLIVSIPSSWERKSSWCNLSHVCLWSKWAAAPEPGEVVWFQESHSERAWQGGNVKGGLQGGAVVVTRAVEESNDRCLFLS